MNHYNHIQTKLEQFISRYHVNALIRGTILFVAIGLLYFLFTLFIEYVLWLEPLARTILFWLFVSVELFLFIKFMVRPLTKLFKLQKGIDYSEAAKIIGAHFPEVNDKLLNIVQLKQEGEPSELLLASIEQKAIELKPIPFKLAVNFRESLRYLKYAAFPVLIILVTFLSGNSYVFSDSYKRVVDYKTAYEPPAPFQFFVVNTNLNAIENTDFKLQIKTQGNLIPESAKIVYNNETYILQQKEMGAFEYVFSQPTEDMEFVLTANGVTSKKYTLKVIEVPSILDFDMTLDFPKHTKKRLETINSSGNAVIPEGTVISWQVKTKTTDKVQLFSKDTLDFYADKANRFTLSKPVYSDFDYTLSTSNASLNNYENLGFSIKVVKDEYPELELMMKVDSLDLQTLYFHGQISDDYGFTKLQLVYYPTNEVSRKGLVNMPFSNSNIDDFITAFPNTLDIEAGVEYQLYFQVFDNDAINNFKSTKSRIFTYRKRTNTEDEQRLLKEQNQTISEFNTSLGKLQEQDKQLEELSKTQKEKSTLNFNDRKKLESFLKRQEQQDEMMKNFNKKLKDNLQNFQKDNLKDDVFKEDLKKRLNENEAQLQEDEKLLEELKRLQKRINKEELSLKLDQLAKQNKNKKRSLEQLVELTKRFYVEKKLEKLKDDLLELANDQEKLSNQPNEDNTKEKQDVLSAQFERFKEAMERLEKDTELLSKPIDIPRDKLDEREVDDEQNKASEALDKYEKGKSSDKDNSGVDNRSDDEKEKAKKSQKKAAQKMKEMSDKMQTSMAGGSANEMQEDAEMLRQILDNLLLFSFAQEDLMENFKAIEVNNNNYATLLRHQKSLKTHFEHVDDSLFALSLRQPKLSETVNKEISEVYYNIDKALDVFAENQMFQGISSQQFTITAANNLADFLSEVLDNMQESLSMSAGQGGDGDMQLPDIIMSQEALNKMMEEGMKKGEKGKEGQGEKNGAQGKEDKPGQSGNDVKQNGGFGNGFSEDLNGELFEIYRQQQELRKALETQLLKDGQGSKGRSNGLLKQMEEVELDLLNKGFTNETLQKMMALKHQLLKMENASFQQGEDNKRESKTNVNEFENTSNNSIPSAKQYFNTTEILNRQSLPLHEIYKKRVKAYFKTKQ